MMNTRRKKRPVHSKRPTLFLFVGLSIIIASVIIGLVYFIPNLKTTAATNTQDDNTAAAHPSVQSADQPSSLDDHALDAAHASNNTAANAIAKQIRAEVVSICGETVDFLSFFQNLDDYANFTIDFESDPPWDTAGTYEVPFTITDADGGNSRAVSKLTILSGTVAAQVEIGQCTEITVDHFIYTPQGYDASLKSTLSPTQLTRLGDYKAIVNLNGRDVTCAVQVADTLPPTAAASDLTLTRPQTAEPLDFCEDVYDATPVTAAFLAEPDWTYIGTQPVTVRLTDLPGNATEITANLTIDRDHVPPVISGVTDKAVVAGAKIAYKSGVTVTDNLDGEISVSVDSSAVQINEEGSYPVVYSAVDSSGNRSQVVATLTVTASYEASVIYSIDKMLADLALQEKSDEEKVAAIYKKIRTFLMYAGGTEHNDVYKTVYDGLNSRKGDCYMYYAFGEVMLTRAGIENLPIRRIPGFHTNHFWSLININDAWYHFDATPSNLGWYYPMFTQTKAEELTIERGFERNSDYYYYVYDKSLYPEVTP